MSDWKGGLTALVQLGEFEGAAMWFNQVALSLKGYKEGAILLFRGGELSHFVSEWTGQYRYAFDRTTHESVRRAVMQNLAGENPGRPNNKKKRKRHNVDDKKDGEFKKGNEDSDSDGDNHDNGADKGAAKAKNDQTQDIDVRITRSMSNEPRKAEDSGAKGPKPPTQRAKAKKAPAKNAKKVKKEKEPTNKKPKTSKAPRAKKAKVGKEAPAPTTRITRSRATKER